MLPRMSSPAQLVPGAIDALAALNEAAHAAGVPESTLALCHLRASQLNGSSPCVTSGAQHLRTLDETDERIFAVAAWRDTPYFTAAERAALALTEAVTRLADRPDPVPDEVWDVAAKHYDEPDLAALLVHIATSNVFNRLNAATRQHSGSGW